METMQSTISYVSNMYADLLDNKADPRTKNWFMVRTPIPALTLVTFYLVFVLKIGPQMMAKRKPYELKTLMIVYNAIQAACATYLFIKGGIYGWFTRYSWTCQPPTLDHPDEITMLELARGFYLIRFLEFADTIIFVLRKKFNQISMLHLVHHSTVPLLFWLGMLIQPTGHYTFAGWVNAFVHSFMYTYYMLAAMGPKYQKYVWWKIYMTKLQLAQFLLVLLHTINTLASDCEVPKIFGWIMICQAILFFSMFFNFYLVAFSKQKTGLMISKYLSKIYAEFKMYNPLEMCIPNQELLYDDGPSEDNFKENNKISVIKNGILKHKLQ